MSTILKALRRLEEEKAVHTEGRPLREEIAIPQAPRPRGPQRFAWPAVLSLGVALIGGGAVASWWMQREGEETATVAAGSGAAPPAPVSVAAEPATRRAPLAAASGAAPPSQAFASEVEVVARPERQPRLADSRPVEARDAPTAGAKRPVESSSAVARARQAAREREADARAAAPSVAAAREPDPVVAARPAPAPVVAAQPEPAPTPALAEPRPQPAPAAPPAPTRLARNAAEPAPAPEPRAARPAPPEPRAATPAPKPAPSQAAAPPVARVVPPPEPEPAASSEAPAIADTAPADAPVLRIERTQWHPVPDRRSAWLRLEGENETRRVVEGDVVAGLIVAKIEPSGVVLERDGERHRQKIGAP